jgi:predicted SprT family Zn-dependent metalloprotease
MKNKVILLAGNEHKKVKANESRLYHCSKCNNMIAKSKNLNIDKGLIMIKCEKCGTFNTI